MWFGISCLIIFAAICVAAYMFYIRRKRIAAAQKIYELHVANDTARIIQEHRVEEVDKYWEEYDKQQWDKRFNN